MANGEWRMGNWELGHWELGASPAPLGGMGEGIGSWALELTPITNNK
jgi:hypothetical protein